MYPVSSTSAPYFAKIEEKVKPVSRPNPIPLVEQAISSLACKIHKSLSSQGGSVCFSPLSLIPVLAMAAEGMGEHDQKEFLISLGLEAIGIEGLRDALKTILKQLSPENNTIKIDVYNRESQERETIQKEIFSLKTAQAVAVAKPVFKTFLDKCQKEYDAEVFNCGTESQEVCRTVNEWVHSKTNGKISELLTTVPPNLSSILLNALYFIADWDGKFSVRETKPKPFHLVNESFDVPMMHSHSRFKIFHSEDNTFSMVEFPFKAPRGHYLSCMIFLPREIKDPAFLEEQLDLNFIKHCSSHTNSRELKLQLPKIDMVIKIEDLLPHLNGIISKGTSVPEIAQNCQIDQVVHKTKLKFDEKGVEGSSVTAMIAIAAGCARSIPTQPDEFIVDHPFAFVIKFDNTIIFQGSVKEAASFSKT